MTDDNNNNGSVNSNDQVRPDQKVQSSLRDAKSGELLQVNGESFDVFQQALTGADVSGVTGVAGTVQTIASFRRAATGSTLEHPTTIVIRNPFETATLVADHLGTRAPSIVKDYSQPLFAEWIGRNFSFEELSDAVRLLMSLASQSNLTNRFGARATARVYQKSIPESVIESRLGGLAANNELLSALAVAAYRKVDLIADHQPVSVVSHPKDLVPTRVQLAGRLQQYRVLSAIRVALETHTKPAPDPRSMTPTSIDSYLFELFQAFNVALMQAQTAQDQFDLTMSAMQAMLLKEHMTGLPDYVTSSAQLDALTKDAVLVQAALETPIHEGAKLFSFGEVTKLDAEEKQTRAGVFAAMASLLPSAVSYVAKWLGEDPYFKQISLSSVADAFQVERVMDQNHAIRGGLIRFETKMVDPAPAVGVSTHAGAADFMVLSPNMLSGADGRFSRVDQFQPVIRSEMSSSLSALMANMFDAHRADLLATYVPDPQLLSLAAMSLADQVHLMIDVDSTRELDSRMNPSSSVNLLVYEHGLVDAVGFVQDLRETIINEALMGVDGSKARTIDTDGYAQSSGRNAGITQVDESVQDLLLDSNVMDRMTLRVGSARSVFSVDPRVVLLAMGPRSVKTPFELGVHRLDYAGLSRTYVSGLARVTASLKRTLTFEQSQVGRYRDLSYTFDMAKIMSALPDASLFLQPAAVPIYEQYFSLFGAAYDLVHGSQAVALFDGQTLPSQRMMLASHVMSMVSEFVGSSDASAIMTAVRSAAYMMQQQGALGDAFSRRHSDDQRLALFIVSAYMLGGLAVFAQFADGVDVLIGQLGEVIASDEFATLYATSSLAAKISL